MKKINNQGWGLAIFIVYMSIFFIAIVLVSYIANKNNLGADSTIQTGIDEYTLRQYKSYENEVKNVAIAYQKKNYSNMNDGDSIYVNINKINVSSNILDRCSGYVKIANDRGIYSATPYLRCGSYRSSGYLSNYDK